MNTITHLLKNVFGQAEETEESSPTEPSQEHQSPPQTTVVAEQQQASVVGPPISPAAASGPLVVSMGICDHEMVTRAFALLTNRHVSKSVEEFTVSTETVDHENMGRFTTLMLKQYAHADRQVRNYIERLQYNDQGQQFAKAIIVGTKNKFSVSVIATKRDKTATFDKHKILIATMKKTVTMGTALDLFIRFFGADTEQQRELTQIVTSLNEEDNKKCLEAMAVYMLGEKIKTFLSTDEVQVRFVQNGEESST